MQYFCTFFSPFPSAKSDTVICQICQIFTFPPPIRYDA